MTDSKQHKILIVEHDQDLRSRIEKVLTDAGHMVQCRTVSLEGIALLEESQDKPFSLAISTYRMPILGGDKILELAKLISPLTQRIIIADPVEIKTVVGAVNKAGVHACMLIPFTDEELLVQVNLCLEAHSMEIKRVNLIKVTERQNWQMYKLAKNFKHRDSLFAAQIKEKTRQLRVEQSKLKAGSGSGPAHLLTLEDFLRSKIDSFSPETFAHAFQNLSNLALTLLNNAGAEVGIALEPMTWEAAQKAAPTSRQE